MQAFRFKNSTFLPLLCFTSSSFSVLCYVYLIFITERCSKRRRSEWLGCVTRIAETKMVKNFLEVSQRMGEKWVSPEQEI
jgi:hypothetical protein